MAVTALLRGGSRDGETTELADEVTRLYAASDAPGLLDVYAETEELARTPAGEAAVVFVWAGQESAAGIAPEAVHMPSGH